MGYPTISEFDKEFIKRTRENLEVKLPNNYTHLINSLLGLLVLPRQWHEQKKRTLSFVNELIANQNDLIFLKNTAVITDEYNAKIELAKLEFKYQKFEEISIGTLLERMRHSIAHQSLRPTREGSKWSGVLFRNYTNETRAAQWGDNFDLQVYFAMAELKTFAIYVSDRYLAELDNIFQSIPTGEGEVK